MASTPRQLAGSQKLFVATSTMESAEDRPRGNDTESLNTTLERCILTEAQNARISRGP